MRGPHHLYRSAEGLRLFFEGEGDLSKYASADYQPPLKFTPRHTWTSNTMASVPFLKKDGVLLGYAVQRALILAAWMNTRRSRDFVWVELNGGSLFLVDKQWQLQGSHLDPPHRLWRCPGKQHQNGFRQYTHRAVDFWWVKEIEKYVMVVLIAPKFPRCPLLTQLPSSSPPPTIPELYFLIARFLEAGPCQKAAEVGFFAF